MSDLRWRTENVAFFDANPSYKTSGFLPVIKAVIGAARSIGQNGCRSRRPQLQFSQPALINLPLTQLGSRQRFTIG